ncbi:MAG: DNA translocase FtsK 4TM domain-containing protein [Planctomycetota bacterium]|nr:DNA translocase FtsK 4TM domain-containing protein [Planctomycetota bacterium]
MNTRRIAIDALALGLLAVVGFLALSLLSYNPEDPPSRMVYPMPTEVTNLAGPTGAKVAHGLRMNLGLGAYFLLFALASFDARLFAREDTPAETDAADFDPEDESLPGEGADADDAGKAATPVPVYSRLAGAILGVCGTCLLLQTVFPSLGNTTIGSGGLFGNWAALAFAEEFTTAGIVMLAFSMTTAGVVLSSEFKLIGFVIRMLATPIKLALTTITATRRALQRIRLKRTARTTAGTLARSVGLEFDASDTDSFENAVDHDLDDVQPTTTMPLAEIEEPALISKFADRKEIRVNRPAGGRSAREEMIARLEASSRESAQPFLLPGLELFDEAEEFPYELLAKSARVAAATLERTFQEFGLNIRVVEIDTGPVITQFELELEAGLRLSKVTALADDLAVALRVPSVRVVSPIPGKNTVGVEVPNEKRVMVRLRELVESCPTEFDKKRIPIYLGKDVSGRPLVVDLTQMPHLLIAGRTGTGKSVCLNTLILSMLMTRRPDQVKMLMIDPKMVELSPYKRVPHLMHPVITDMKKAEAVLAWAVDKMEERYDLLSRCGVRHLDGYNKLDHDQILSRMKVDPDSAEADEIPSSMPYIVIIADEMADMMMTSGKDVEGHIIRLAQKSRAVGIHLVLATQKPTVDVITGLIKSNLPARISFQVASRTDSRVVLDEMGADKLLGNGDMLYLAPGTSNLTRAQGTFVSDEECNAVIDFYSDREPEYCEELAQISANAATAGKSEADTNRQRDDLYDHAISCVVREGRGSVSLLQRHLGIGYGRAARLIDYMAEDGIVGDYNGSQAREVLYTVDQWESMQSGPPPDENNSFADAEHELVAVGANS